MNSFLLCLAVLVTVASGVAALKCYDCISCYDPFDTNSARIEENCKACFKGKIGDTMARACLPIDLGDKCEEEACSCKSDLCNSAHRRGLSYISLIFYTLAAIIIWKI